MATSIDTETSLVSDLEPVPRMVCASMSWEEPTEPGGIATALLHHNDVDVPDLICGLLKDATPAEKLATANGSFDGIVTAQRYEPRDPTELGPVETAWWDALERGVVADVLLEEKLLDIADGFTGPKFKGRKFNLGAVAERRSGIKVDKEDPWRLRYVELIDTPLEDWPQAAADYASNDAEATLHVHLRQRQVRVEGLDPLENAPAQLRGHWALHLSQLWGVVADPAKVAALDARLLADREVLKSGLQELTVDGEPLARPDGSISIKVAQKLAKEAGVTRKTKRGLGLSEDDFVVLGLGPEHPLMRMVRYSSLGRERTKMRNAFMRPMIRPWYHLLETGRVSATDPSTMNLPREGGYRECLVPRDGNVFVSMDWSGCQLKCWAHLLVVMFGEDAPSAAMAKALREGKDVHGTLGEVLGTDRQTAKGPNFGFIGAMGIDRFIAHVRDQSGVILTREQAISYKNGWLKTWRPQAFFDWLAETSEHGCVRQPGSNRLRAGCSYSEIALQLIQGMEADIAKETLWKLAKEMYTEPDSPLYGARQALFVHDENVLECPRGQAQAVADRGVEIMNEVANSWHFHVPSDVDVKILRAGYSKEG